MKNDNDSVLIFFDRLTYRVSFDTLKVLISDEISRLSSATGYNIKNIPILFEINTKDNVVACFTHRGDIPVSFTFNLNKFNGTSANKIIDTVRHEFAHFVVCLEHKGAQPKDPHGKEWKDTCKRLDAIPSPYMIKSLTRHFE